jgi:predicted N-acetyltransferase YhbS
MKANAFPETSLPGHGLFMPLGHPEFYDHTGYRETGEAKTKHESLHRRGRQEKEGWE